MGFFNDDEWPYEITPSIDEYSNVWADQSDLKKLFSNLIIVEGDILRKQLVTVYGYFGAGKTHKLLFLKNKIEKNNFGFCIISRIPHGTKNFAEIYKSLFFDQVYEKFIQKYKEFSIENMDLDSSELRKKISKEITHANPTLTTAFTKFAQLLSEKSENSPEIISLQNWLRGESLKKDTKEWIGRKLKDDTDFIDATQAILKVLLRKNSRSDLREPVYWFIDDCHFLSELEPRSKFNAIQKGFLDIYNVSDKGVTLLFAFAGETEHSVDLSSDLLQRRDEKINVHVLTPSQALIYIKELNSEKRFSTDPDRSNKFYPLTEDSSKKLIELFNKGNIPLLPRKINLYLNKIVFSAQKEKLNELDVNHIDQKFKFYHAQLKTETEELDVEQ